jgi:hypothetical protein
MPKPTNLALEEFIDKFNERLASPDSISKSVQERNIVIAAPGKGNKGTLAEIDDQFDEHGMKKSSAIFSYSEPDRTERDMQKFTTEAMSDREKLVFTSVLFCVGSDMIVADHTSNDQINQLRDFIASKLSALPLFTPADSFIVNPQMATELTQLRNNSIGAGKQVDEALAFTKAIQAIRSPTSSQKSHLKTMAEKDKKGSNKEKVHAEKKEIMADAYTALDTFLQNQNLSQLNNTVNNLKTRIGNVPTGSGTKSATRKLISSLVELVGKRAEATGLTSRATSPSPSRPGSPKLFDHADKTNSATSATSSQTSSAQSSPRHK